MKTSPFREDWEIVKRFLPYGWEDKATTLGALVRKRKILSADVLLRVLLIHLIDGKSLRTTAAYAREAGLCDINDVALLHRLRASSEWFRWMAVELTKELKGSSNFNKITRKYRIRLVDGSVVSEPGSTGTDWRIHYSFCLRGFTCDTFKITSPKEGECLQKFSVEKNDFIIGDRGYCKRKGIKHVLRYGGQVLVRFHSNNLPLFTQRGKSFPILDKLKNLDKSEIGDWNVWFRDPDDDNLTKGRLCAIRKSEEVASKAVKQAISYAKKKKRKIRDRTLVFTEYICLFTTVSRHKFKKKDILLLYRGRWQIELAFKRMKSITGIGHLPKYQEESCIAWLQGKMFIALLVERIYQEADFFSPWGYPIK